MGCVPTARLALAQVAVRRLPLPTSATAPQPLTVVPLSVNVAFPVGAFPDTVAVKVTAVPKVTGLAELDNVVVEPKLLTTCASGALLDAAFPASPA